MNHFGMRIIFIFGFLLQLLIIGNIQAQVTFYADQTEGCTDFNAKFTADFSSVDRDTITNVKWHFGEGDTIVALNHDSIRHTYTRPGIYKVVMVINNRKNAAVVRTDYITVHPTLYSNFDMQQLDAANNYQFTGTNNIPDNSALYTYTWQYLNTTSGVLTTHTYTVDNNTPDYKLDEFTFDTGIYNVTLNITDSYGCESNFSRSVTIAPEIPPIPNVFVPEVHKFFIIEPQDQGVVLLFKLFNRHGMLLFQQEAEIINWNGKSNSGFDLNTGVYYYILEATSGDPLGRYSKTGFIHIFR